MCRHPTWRDKPASTSIGLPLWQQLVGGPNFNCAQDRTRNRTALHVDAVHSLDHFCHLLRGAKLVVDRDSADDKHVAFYPNLTHRLRCQLTVRGIDLARLQRTSEGPRESTRRGGNDIIKRSGMRRICARVDLVVLCDL